MSSTATKMVADIAARRGVQLGAVTGSDTSPSMELAMEDGDETAIVIRHAAANDLFYHRGAFGDGLFVTGALVKDVLEDSGRPLLLTSGRVAPTFPTSAAMAWSGSAEGARAVTAALPFLAKAEKVSILTRRRREPTCRKVPGSPLTCRATASQRRPAQCRTSRTR